MRPKYRNRRTGNYASAGEARRAAELRALQAAGHISELREQVRFEVIPKQEGERAAHYVADFVYVEDGRQVVEDFKGYATPEFVLKRKLMLLVHGIRLRVTK